MILLSLSVSVVHLDYRKVIIFVALYIIAIGEGGHRPCVQTFAADQFEEDSLENKKVKSSFFNWWFWGIVLGPSIGILGVIYVEDNISWTVATVVLAVAMAAALILLLLGIKRYRKQGPIGSPLTTMAQVLVAAVRKWRVDKKRDSGGDYHEDGLLTPPEVKLVLRLFPVWLSCLMYAIIVAQMNTFFVKQGSTLQRSITPHFVLPPASLQAIVGLTIVLVLPIYQRFFVPFARKFTGHPSGITMLRRIGIGLFLSVLIMVVSSLVETRGINVVKEYNLLDHPKVIVPMKAWWLLPQYILTGLVEIFAYVGLQELFYSQMPEAMRSIGSALNLSVNGIGNLASSAIISMVQTISSNDNLNRAHLNHFYWVLAGIGALNFCFFLWIAKRFEYKKFDDDDVPEEKE
ncbi:hypothetical protein ACB094_11G153400 [Castanea mollissima]